MKDEEFKKFLEVVSILADTQHFIDTYSVNPDKVFKQVASRLKVVPINLKSTLAYFYKSLNAPKPEGHA